ncbi:MAG: transposase family protein, partial [Sphaerochaetaceae bacterium]|nr:transposase family protein [Sphaerochaetaceae bacterium]
MNEFITLAHKLPYFNVTAESEWMPCTSGGHIVRAPGIINLPAPEYCPKCEFKVHNHSYETVRIKDIPLMKSPHILEVKFGRHKCSECGT